MAIDKTIPNKLQADLDQRYVRPEAGEMIDAQNVIVTESGANTDGVMQNMYGTIAATPPELNALPQDNVTVIGSVSDSQRGFIYFFVADNNGSTQHAIYRLDTSDNSYELVLKASGLNFDRNGFVKADVVNAAFQQDGVIQTVLYFTDNRNPPRKINVDRAINSAVYDATQSTFDTVISACKPAMNGFPTVRFATDEDLTENNFRTELFQFAVQMIYTDGEESAISGYSELAIPRPAIFATMEESGFGLSPYVDNVCEVTIPIDFQTPDLESIRIIARDGNNGAFFVVDEFDPDQDLYRQVFGSSKQIYDASARMYRFYNNSLGRAVSNDTVSKLYDNTPFLAQGQSVTGNRLMYSNYEEGRPNAITNAEFTVTYIDDDGTGSNNYIPKKAVSGVISESSTGFVIDIDALPVGAFDTIESSPDTSTIIPQGTRLELSFDFGLDFRMGVTSTDADNPISVSLENDGTDYVYVANVYDTSTGQKENPDIMFLRKTTGQKARVVFTHTVTSGSGQQVGSAFNALLNSTPSVNIKYMVWNRTESFPNGVVVRNLELIYTQNPAAARAYISTQSSPYYLDVEWKLPVKSITSSTWEIYPYVSEIGKGTAVFTDDENTPNSDFSYTNENPNLLNASLYTSVVNEYDRQAEIDYEDHQGGGADISSYISGRYASASSTPFLKTFKSGSSHTFGIVYYDEFNRSGNVNLLGSVYVEPLASDARSGTERGACTITVDLSETVPPDWAYYYQIVYAGPDSYSDYVQYTTSGGYFKHQDATTHEPDHHIENVYVCLSTLDIFNDEKKSSRTYSFTEGDKLRLISRYNSVARDFEYSLNNQSIEFDVIGVETIDIEVHGQVGNNSFEAASGSDVGKTALILSAPQVNAGIDRFTGYDWFSITGTSLNDIENPVATDAVNRWGAGTVVEILTPRKHTEERVFYEMGHGGTISSGEFDSTSIVLTNGDAYFRPVSCKTATSEATVSDADEYVYRTFFLESNTVSDGFDSKDWHRGRPHVVFENAATVRRQNGITYSDAYEEDVANLSLSSFNASLANFFSLEASNGACNYIGSFREDFLVALQENKMAMVPVKKSILSTASSGELLGLNTDVLNSPQYYVGDYGCGDNPESVLIQDNQVFFADLSRRKILRWTGEGISPISDNGVASLLSTNLDNYTASGGTRIVSGYDPRFDQYFVTLPIQGNFGGFTLGYNVPTLSWQSRYTFFPTNYASQNDMMYSCLYNQGDTQNNLFFSHDHNGNNVDANGDLIPGGRNRFYRTDTVTGDTITSRVSVVSNYNPSMVKVFNALSIETDSNWTVDEVVTDLGSVSRTFALTEKEGALYGAMGGDESVNSSMHIIPLGRIASFTTNTVTFTKRVNTLPLMVGATVMRMNSGTLEQIGVNDAVIAFNGLQNSTTINLSGQPVISEGEDLVLVTLQSQNGDPIRGHWAEVTISNNQATPFELFCVNTHFADSKQNHALGQQ